MDSLKKIAAFYDIFRDLSRAVHSSTDVKEVLDLVVRKSCEAISAKGALLRILNLKTSELELSAAYGLSEQYLSKGHVSSQKVITDLCRANRIIIIEDVLTDPRVQYPKEAREEGIKSMVDLPLTLGEHVVGIIRIFFEEQRQFSDDELNFLVSTAEQSACAIDKARLIETHKSRYDNLALQTEKMSALGRMAAGVAHEINNPMAGILLYSTNMIKKVPKDTPLREGLEIIIHETIRCKTIIQELLEFSREGAPQKALININSILERTLRILKNEFRLRHITIEKRFNNKVPDILLDANQMEQVFVNLLFNAIEAIKEQGVITIETGMDPEQKYAKIQISDTGCGISPKHTDRIFEPFFSTKSKGTGLGLAVSYGIVQNHQGNIWVFSQPEQGTCFTIEIPLLEGPSSIKTEGREDGTG
jgi:signal transduction histidine kinase